jgi:hypothetical protein
VVSEAKIYRKNSSTVDLSTPGTSSNPFQLDLKTKLTPKYLQNSWLIYIQHQQERGGNTPPQALNRLHSLQF